MTAEMTKYDVLPTATFGQRVAEDEGDALKAPLEALRGEKILQTPNSLAAIWKCPEEEALYTAQELVDVGFFERRGAREAPEFWVPFLYREALDLVQGAAE